MLPSLLIVDDFLADPVEARRQALNLGYDRAAKVGNYPGVTSTRALALPGLDTAVSQLVGLPLIGADATLHGHGRLTLRNDRGASGVHIDPVAFSGILYLNPPDQCAGGTDFYRHRRTGLDRVPTDPAGIAAAGYADINALVEGVVNADTTKPGKWERVQTVPMRCNRLLLFSPWLFHDARPGFGERPDTARLVLLLFFASAPADV